MKLKDIARLTHCAMRDAALWLTVQPIEDRLCLSNDEVMSALHHQFGLSVRSDSGSVYCRCNSPLDAGHAHRCNRVHGPATTDRHNEIVAELSALSQELCQIKPQIEPIVKVIESDDDT